MRHSRIAGAFEVARVPSAPLDLLMARAARSACSNTALSSCRVGHAMKMLFCMVAVFVPKMAICVPL